MSTGLEHLVLSDDEVLAENRNVDLFPYRVEVGEGSLETTLLGENTDGGCSANPVLIGQRSRIANRREVTLRRTGPLDLGDDRQTRRGQPRNGVNCGCDEFDGLVKVVRGDHELALMEILENTSDDLVKNCSGDGGRHSACSAITHGAHHQGDDTAKNNESSADDAGDPAGARHGTDGGDDEANEGDDRTCPVRGAPTVLVLTSGAINAHGVPSGGQARLVPRSWSMMRVDSPSWSGVPSDTRNAANPVMILP